MEKMTRKDYLTLCMGYCEMDADVVAFLQNEIDKEDRKRENVAKRRAEKAEEGDVVYVAVMGCVGKEFTTAEDVLALLDYDEELSIAKVRARLSQGVKKGELIKEARHLDNGKRKVYYKKA